MASGSFFWHDYETFGRNPALFRASQFAGLRTDMDLNVIGEPVNIYCQPSLDTLPEPEACLITGITPQLCREKGVPEPVFAKTVYECLSRPGTCGVGYNSIRFDDNFTRNIFYRNFFPVYEREWKNGNSRWDLIDVMRMARAIRPQGVVWPDKPDGRPCFTLESLVSANGLLHESAHDALSDVMATIELARLLKKSQPRFFDYALSLRVKNNVSAFVNPFTMKPFFHVSSRLKPEHLYSSIMMPLAVLPSQNNAVICFDLMHDPNVLVDGSVEEIRKLVFTPRLELPENAERVALKKVMLNRSPMVSDISVLDDSTIDRLGLDKNLCEKHWKLLLQNRDSVISKVIEVEERDSDRVSEDAETRLYDGFFTKADEGLFSRVRSANEQMLSSGVLHFSDDRLQELLFRYRARNFPASLSEDERRDWQNYRRKRLSGNHAVDLMTPEEYDSRIESLMTESKTDATRQGILRALQEWKAQLLQTV